MRTVSWSVNTCTINCWYSLWRTRNFGMLILRKPWVKLPSIYWSWHRYILSCTDSQQHFLSLIKINLLISSVVVHFFTSQHCLCCILTWIWVLFSDFHNNLSCIMTKPTKWHVHPSKTQISLRIRSDWSQSLLSAWRKLASLATHWVHSEDSDQTGQTPRLIWVFAGYTSYNWFCHFNNEEVDIID